MSAKRMPHKPDTRARADIACAQSRGFYPDKYAFKINLRVSEIM